MRYLQLMLFVGLIPACNSKPQATPSRGSPDVIPVSASDNRAISRLIEQLKSGNDDDGYSVAIKLAEYKKTAIPFLVKGLQSTNPGVRKWCARAITNMVGGYREISGRGDTTAAGSPLLAALTREHDENVAWYMVQAIGAVQPPISESLPILIQKISTSGLKVQSELVDAIHRYGPEAKPAKSALISLLLQNNDDGLRWDIVNALEEFGINESEAHQLSEARFQNGSFAATDLLVMLLRFPNPAITFLNSHPELFTKLSHFTRDVELVEVLKDTSTEKAELRKLLIERKDLPTTVMVRLGDSKFLPRIQTRIAIAKSHERTFLMACGRALGEKSDTVVEISEKIEGDFKPKSAHPGSDPDRWAPSNGHGDGATAVMITGQLIMDDGSPAVEPRFYNANDRMLMGQKQKTPAPLIRYDAASGRFVFLTSVFAAYSMVEGQKEPGPYQTGSAWTLIEAQNAKPLTVEFYDEMPDVKITLTKMVAAVPDGNQPATDDRIHEPARDLPKMPSPVFPK